MVLLSPTGKILLLQQFLVTSKIMLNRLQTVHSSNLIIVVIVKDMLAYKVSVLDSGFETRSLFLGNHMSTGPYRCSVFIQDGNFKSFQNYTIKLSAKETKWTGLGVRACFSILLLLILKYGFRPVRLAEI